MIIGISGKMCAGKDAATDTIVATFDGCRVAFADELKRQAKRLVFELTGATIDPWNDKRDPVRGLLQQLGMAGRAYDCDLWVNAALAEARRKELAYGFAVIVIPDVRFPNEAAAITAAGGKLLRLSRPEEARFATITRLYGAIDPARLTHESETALDAYDGWNAEIYATTPKDLADMVKAVVGGWLYDSLYGAAAGCNSVDALAADGICREVGR